MTPARSWCTRGLLACNRSRARERWLSHHLTLVLCARGILWVRSHANMQGRTIQRFLCPAVARRRPVTRLRLYRALRNESDVIPGPLEGRGIDTLACVPRLKRRRSLPLVFRQARDLAVDFGAHLAIANRPFANRSFSSSLATCRRGRESRVYVSMPAFTIPSSNAEQRGYL